MKCSINKGGLAALRERALVQGLGAMGDLDLTELLLGRGCTEKGGFESLSGDLAQFSMAPARDLAGVLGLTELEGLQLSAAFALGRRVETARVEPRPQMQSSEAIFRYLRPAIRGVQKERFFVLLLDGKHRLLRQEIVSEGTLTTSLVHPREVFRPAIREAAAAVVVAHNHPSGDPEPSPEDLEVTRRLLRTGKLVGIPLLDHVVMGEATWVSLRSRMAFP